MIVVITITIVNCGYYDKNYVDDVYDYHYYVDDSYDDNNYVDDSYDDNNYVDDGL